MPTEQFPIKSWLTGAVMLTAEIECDPKTHPRIKLGLAVEWAVKSRADLFGANLSDARLDGARLDGARLDGARLDGASLVGASLVGASLDGARLDGARLDRARLDGADLFGANLSEASLVGARLDGARLDGASLVGASLVGASLDGASIFGDKIRRLIARVDRLDGYQFAAFELEAGGVKIKAGCRWLPPAEYRAHVAGKYPGTDKASETLAILDFIDIRAAQMGVVQQKER